MVGRGVVHSLLPWSQWKINEPQQNSREAERLLGLIHSPQLKRLGRREGLGVCVYVFVCRGRYEEWASLKRNTNQDTPRCTGAPDLICTSTTEGRKSKKKKKKTGRKTIRMEIMTAAKCSWRVSSWMQQDGLCLPLLLFSRLPPSLTS